MIELAEEEVCSMSSETRESLCELQDELALFDIAAGGYELCSGTGPLVLIEHVDAVHCAGQSRRTADHVEGIVVRVQDLASFFLSEIIRSEITFKTCRCCGRYFPSYVHGNAEYCERLFQDDKTCKEIGAVSMFRARLEEYPAMQLYQRAYKTRFARIKAKRMTKEQFVVWGKEARGYRDSVLRGEMRLEEFGAWLKEN